MINTAITRMTASVNRCDLLLSVVIDLFGAEKRKSCAAVKHSSGREGGASPVKNTPLILPYMPVDKTHQVIGHTLN